MGSNIEFLRIIDASGVNCSVRDRQRVNDDELIPGLYLTIY